MARDQSPRGPSGREVKPLKFDVDERSARIGDELPESTQRELFPPRRVREAGLTAGETTHPEHNTADDAAPDTLLDDDGGQNPADQGGPQAADTALRIVDETAIGAGGGLDEAEEARRTPSPPPRDRKRGSGR